jgi:hypothetical protein
VAEAAVGKDPPWSLVVGPGSTDRGLSISLGSLASEPLEAAL